MPKEESRNDDFVEEKVPRLRLVTAHHFGDRGDSAASDEHTIWSIDLSGEDFIRTIFLIGNTLYFQRRYTLFTFDLDAPLPPLKERPKNLSKEESWRFDSSVPLPEHFRTIAEIPPDTYLIQTPNKAILAVGLETYQVIVPSS